MGLSGLGSCVFMGVLSPLHPRAWATDGGQTWEFLTALTLRWCWAGVRLWEAMRPCSGVGNTVEGPRGLLELAQGSLGLLGGHGHLVLMLY